MAKTIQEVEAEIDAQLEELGIWGNSYQSILSILLYTAETLDEKGNSDTAMDYISRLSYLVEKIKEKATRVGTTRTSEAILATQAHLSDVVFLNAYAHFAMLMPEVHRGLYQIERLSEKKFRLTYLSKETKQAELIDKLYSSLALQMSVEYPKIRDLREYLSHSMISGREDAIITDVDYTWIASLNSFHRSVSLNIEVLPSDVYLENFGFEFQDYIAFVGAARAFATFYIELGRCYKSAALAEPSSQRQEELMNEYLEWTNLCLLHSSIGMIMGLAGIEKEPFLKILSYFTFIYHDNTGNDYETNSFPGDAYFPPFHLVEEYFIYSPHALRCMLTINNILYSSNKVNTEAFNKKVSSHLEPTLIKQLTYLFSKLKGVRCEPNVSFPASEIDLLVLSEGEKVCLNIQVKTTIAPDSARTVRNVQSRSLEGITQLKIFESGSDSERLDLINKTFETNLEEVKLISILVVRSSAGTEKIWRYNKDYKIVNYPFLGALLSKKVNSGDFSLVNIEDEILELQNEMIASSNSQIQTETLKIGEYEIQFPNISFNSADVLSMNINTLKAYENFESANPEGTRS